MTPAVALLDDAFTRIGEHASTVVDGLSTDDLSHRIAPDANTIGWLVWHLTRVQDHHVAEILDTQQVWVGDEWASRFGLDPDPSNTGYGHRASEVLTVQPESPRALVEYLDAVAQRTRGMLTGVDEVGLDRIVDRRWDPPVTLGVRLVSIADDCLQHAGQANYIRGLLDT